MKALTKSIFLAVVFWGSAVTALAVSSEPSFPVNNKHTLKPLAGEDEACKYISNYLLQHHYRKLSDKDSLSQEIFNRYLNNLDNSKTLFLASEVDSLKKIYGTRIIDECLGGHLNAGFAVYNLFIRRSKEKINYMHNAVSKVHFNFSQPETLSLDRKNDPWPSDRKHLTDLWAKELKYRWLDLLSSGETNKTIRVALYKSFTTRENILNRKKAEDVFQAYIAAVTKSFDPHTSYFSPNMSESFLIDMSHSVDGIGVKLDTEGEFTVITEVIPRGSAFRSKLLKKGDKIIGVGQGVNTSITDVFGWKTEDIAKLIRGKKGTFTCLKILPYSQSGRAQVKIATLMRDKINMEDDLASKSIIQQYGHKIGVITIPSFYLDFEGKEKNDEHYNSISHDVAQILKELKDEEVEGIIIDLRNNGGGALEEAVKVTGLFIPFGPFVQISNSAGKVALLCSDDNTQKQYSGPLAVLVNRYTASASEIFAAAVQDYNRGVIIGERTFGKGTVQHIIKLPKTEKSTELGDIKLTVAKYFRVSGGSTQHEGVVPDIIMPSMIDNTSIGEDTYTNSLPWSSLSRASFMPTKDVNSEEISLLNHQFLGRASKTQQFQAYLHDVSVLNQIRKRKTVSLQERPFKSDKEIIKRLEKKWDQGKRLNRDVLLTEAESVVSDLIALKRSLLSFTRNKVSQ